MPRAKAKAKAKAKARAQRAAQVEASNERRDRRVAAVRELNRCSHSEAWSSEVLATATVK